MSQDSHRGGSLGYSSLCIMCPDLNVQREFLRRTRAGALLHIAQAPPSWDTLRAARVMQVRRPACDEHPSIFSDVESRWHHKRTIAGDSPPPRSEKKIGR